MIFPLVSALPGPPCNYEKIKEISNFIIKGEVVEVKILDEWTHEVDEFYTKFASVQIKIKVTEVVKGEKNIGDEVVFGYETILEDTGGWAGGIYYNLYEVGDFVEYRDISELPMIDDNFCVPFKLKGTEINKIDPNTDPNTGPIDPEPINNDWIYYCIGAAIIGLVIIVIVSKIRD